MTLAVIAEAFSKGKHRFEIFCFLKNPQGSKMTIPQVDKDDVITSVLIELERMFGVLYNRFTPDYPEHVLLLEKIETAMKSALRMVE